MLICNYFKPWMGYVNISGFGKRFNNYAILNYEQHLGF